MSGALRRPWFSRTLHSLKEAGLHLVNLDESGNTGTNLNDKERPIFPLAALIVPEAAWQPLEPELEQAITRHIPTTAIRPVALGKRWRWGHPHFAGPVSGWPLPFAGQAFQPDGLTSRAGQSLTGVVTALLSAATPREMAEECRFIVLSIAPGILS